uniref:Eukaryotic translation initiation factor 3 subunit p66 n=2 Tax=Caenorhabditis japonica TaxID=281687 RepID=A0A8R1EBP3_CAEJA
NLTTTDDTVIQELAQAGVGNVFGTDIIIATLMTAPRSVYSWDIVAYRFGDKLFFEKRNTRDILNPVETLTVSETSAEPPSFDGNGINNAKDLATEAFYINQNFRRQVVKRNEEGYKLKNARAPFEDEEAEECGTGYKYRKWNLGNGIDGKPVELVCRTEFDGVIMGAGNDVQTLTIKAFNEWDSTQAGGVDWRTKLDVQKGAVMATEIKNNSAKVAKWTLQALLAGTDTMKIGYVSRNNPRSTQNHSILNTQYVKPTEFASNIALNMDNCWGILRCVIDR